jgi:GNAT superfamily N-acetyltransferase
VSNDTDSGFVLRQAAIEDVPVVLQCIRELAVYERLAEHCVATEALLRVALAGPEKSVEVTLAFDGEHVAGFALWYRNFSTLLARPGIYLEDLFVFEQFRGRGLGRILLTSLARTAVERAYGRVEWNVLDWNTDAIGFYDSIGAVPVHDWTRYRLAGEALGALADGRRTDRPSG